MEPKPKLNHLSALFIAKASFWFHTLIALTGKNRSNSLDKHQPPIFRTLSTEAQLVLWKRDKSLEWDLQDSMKKTTFSFPHHNLFPKNRTPKGNSGSILMVPNVL